MRPRPDRRVLQAGLGLLLAFLVSPLLAGSDGAVRYRVSFEDRGHHEARIEVRFSELSPGTLELRMSRTSPGRYALHEFAKNVYGLEAHDPSGKPLEVERGDPHQWNVRHEGAVVVKYRLFGDRLDGTYTAVDRRHAHLNVPASFVWARGLEDRPIRVTFELPDPEWRVATQLVATDDPATFTAPDLAYFIDSPIEISHHERLSFPLDGPAGPQTVEIALHHTGSQAEAEAFAHLVELVVDEEVALFGEPPRFDHGRYLFIADYLPGADSDGMEHRNSTILTSSQTLAEQMVPLLDTVSHELFHAWSMERIRSHALEPFDLEDANMSRELWFGEGFTSYYDALVLRRIGLLSLDRYAAGLGELLDEVLNAPGRRWRSPIEMSEQAPFVDSAAWIDSTNVENTYVSYYSYGAVLALGLDLTLRTRFGTDLDTYMRAMWQQHGRPERLYALDDLERVLGEVSGDRHWARGFFAGSIGGSELPDYAGLLESAGLALRPRHPETAWLGHRGLEGRDEGLELTSPPVAGSPLHAAGIGIGDRIISVDGIAVEKLSQLASILADYGSGDRVELEVEPRAPGERSRIEVELAPHPALELVPFEHLGRPVSDEIARFRQAWMGRRSEPRLEVARHCPVCRRTFDLEYEYCAVDGTHLSFVPPGP